MTKKAYVKQAAELLGLTEYQLRRLAKENKVPFIMSGNRYIFDVELCQEHLRKEALANVKAAEEVNSYGMLRKVGI